MVQGLTMFHGSKSAIFHLAEEEIELRIRKTDESIISFQIWK